MKILNTKTLKDGRKHLLIEISPNEKPPEPALESHKFYKLGYPMDDQIVEGYILQGLQRMHWDSYSQKWVEA